MIWIKITENIKAPEVFLIEIGEQQTDHKAAHNRHRDRASKRIQGSFSPQEHHQHAQHQEKHKHPDISGSSFTGSCFGEVGGRAGRKLHRQHPPCWPPCHKSHWADMGIFGSWEMTFRNVPLRQPLSHLGLPWVLGIGGDLGFFTSPDFCLRVSPKELKKKKLNPAEARMNQLGSTQSSLSCTD